MTLRWNPQLCISFLSGPGLELNEKRGQKRKKERKIILYISAQSVSMKIQCLFWINKEKGITYIAHFSLYIYLYKQVCSVHCKTLLEKLGKWKEIWCTWIWLCFSKPKPHLCSYQGNKWLHYRKIYNIQCLLNW